MTAAEHYVKAEQLLVKAERFSFENWGPIAAAAQAHATLALVGATVLAESSPSMALDLLENVVTGKATR